ncbi:cysteine hydrolase family protein [Actinomadura sp. SCN-SB]|uniref:cysteine hydrolase family protein n=1 Tax=Actinomadura sp. SCN-SB TaxID=3373092 RepID=UPI0037539985
MAETTPYESPALVISECQRGILDADRTLSPGLAEQAATRGIVARTARLAREFRERGLPVFHCVVAHRPDRAGIVPNSYLAKIALRRDYMLAETPDVEIPAELGPEPADIVSSRVTGATAFYGTDLDAMLRLQGVRTLILAGVSTNVALPGLAMEAINRGYTAILAEDCTAGASADAHRQMIDNQLGVLARISTADQIAGRLPDRAKPS